MTARSTRIAAGALTVALALTSACRGSHATGTGPSASGAPEQESLPPLVVKDDTPNLLLTWLDDHGDFHVVEHIADVPEASRDAVRVVVADRTDGTGESIYVADFGAKGANGTYPVKTMSRAEWDERGASKRKARLEALAPSAMPPPGAPASSGSAASGTGSPRGDVTATIYGASWCNPCHQAQALLESLGVKVTKKDIEESDEAQREMQEKLRRVHRQGGSIPVIDVMGQIFVGYSEGALRAAVARARSGTL